MDCFFQAKVHLPLSDARWTLNLAKNKLGQRLRRARRREVGNAGWDGGRVEGSLLSVGWNQVLKKDPSRLGYSPALLEFDKLKK